MGKSLRKQASAAPAGTKRVTRRLVPKVARNDPWPLWAGRVQAVPRKIRLSCATSLPPARPRFHLGPAAFGCAVGYGLRVIEAVALPGASRSILVGAAGLRARWGWPFGTAAFHHRWPRSQITPHSDRKIPRLLARLPSTHHRPPKLLLQSRSINHLAENSPIARRLGPLPLLHPCFRFSYGFCFQRASNEQAAKTSCDGKWQKGKHRRVFYPERLSAQHQ